MPSSRQSKITAIIEQRRPLAVSIETVEKNLRTLADALEQLETCRQSLIGRVDEEISGKLQRIDCRSLINEIYDEFGSIGKLKTRFLRNTLNIGVIGRAGQGKSRLLQSLSGLTTIEIPTGDRSHCTGVQSTICHSPNVDTYGEVIFYSEREFIDTVIAPYYTKLNLGPKPFSLDEFERNPLPQLPGAIAKQAVEGAMYEHLRTYHQRISDYRSLMNESLPRQISRDEIREYIAQDNPEGDRVHFKYLAVKEAKIICSFPNADVGQVALIDMPGLGDTGLGDDERLIKILSQDVDLVLFIRLPRPPREYWSDVDVKLYDVAKSALSDLPIEKWSFLILNQTHSDSAIGNNQIYCQDLAQSRHEKHINVVDAITANCADMEEANSRILDRVLDYLTQNIQSLDREYSQSRQAQILKIHSRVSTEVGKSQSILGNITSKSEWYPLFITLFDQLWLNFTTGLEEFLKELSDSRDMPDENFAMEVRRVIETCTEDSGIPTVEEIEKQGYAAGGLPNVYYKYLNEIRAHLSKHFLSLDDGLKESLERIKSEVTHTVKSTSKLGNLSTFSGSKFLNYLASLMPDEIFGQPSEIKRGLDILVAFDLHYRGLVQHRIRQHLDDLTPNRTTLQLSPKPSALEVQECLKSLHSEAVYKCDTALNVLLAEPSQAAFAIVEEFIDRVLRSKLAQNEWRVFLEGVRAEVWPEEFEALGEHTQMRRSWLDSVQKVTDANQLDKLQFWNS